MCVLKQLQLRPILASLSIVLGTHELKVGQPYSSKVSDGLFTLPLKFILSSGQ